MGFCFCSISANTKWPSLSGLSCPPACSLVSAVTHPQTPSPPHPDPPSLSTELAIVPLLSDSAPLAFPYRPQWTRKGRDTVGLQSSSLGVFGGGGVCFVAHSPPPTHLNEPIPQAKMATYLKNAIDSCFVVLPGGADTGTIGPLLVFFSLTPLCSLFSPARRRREGCEGVVNDVTLPPTLIEGRNPLAPTP